MTYYRHIYHSAWHYNVDFIALNKSVQADLLCTYMIIVCQQTNAHVITIHDIDGGDLPPIILWLTSDLIWLTTKYFPFPPGQIYLYAPKGIRSLDTKVYNDYRDLNKSGQNLIPRTSKLFHLGEGGVITLLSPLPLGRPWLIHHHYYWLLLIYT